MNLFTDTLSRILHRNGIPEDQMAFDFVGIWHIDKVSDGGNVFPHPVNTIKVLKARAEQLEVYMPLVAGLHAILFEGRTLQQVIGALMNGEPKTDVDFISISGF